MSSLPKLRAMKSATERLASLFAAADSRRVGSCSVTLPTADILECLWPDGSIVEDWFGLRSAARDLHDKTFLSDREEFRCDIVRWPKTGGKSGLPVPSAEFTAELVWVPQSEGTRRFDEIRRARRRGHVALAARMQSEAEVSMGGSGTIAFRSGEGWVFTPFEKAKDRRLMEVALREAGTVAQAAVTLRHQAESAECGHSQISPEDAKGYVARRRRIAAELDIERGFRFEIRQACAPRTFRALAFGRCSIPQSGKQKRMNQE